MYIASALLEASADMIGRQRRVQGLESSASIEPFAQLSERWVYSGGRRQCGRLLVVALNIALRSFFDATTDADSGENAAYRQTDREVTVPSLGGDPPKKV